MSKAILNTLQSLEQPDKVVDVRDIAMYHETIAKQKTQIYQLLKKSCAEAGLTLVDGSFEEGATVNLKTEVVWQQATGKIFAWFQDAVKVVSAGSTPATSGGVGAGAWVDRSDVTLRSEINNIWRNFSCVSDVDGNVSIGEKISVENYYLNGRSGNLFFTVVAAGTGVHDGGKYIDLPSSGLQLVQNLNIPYNPKAWGAKGDKITNDTTPIQCTYKYSASQVNSNNSHINSYTQPNIVFDSGVYIVNESITNASSSTDSAQGLIIDGNGAVLYGGDGTFNFFDFRFDCELRNLAIHGGGRAFYIQTGNADSAQIRALNCTFLNQTIETFGSDSNSASTLVNIDKCKIYQINDSGTGTKLIADIQCDVINIENSWIYYGGTGIPFVIRSICNVKNNLFVPNYLLGSYGTQDAWFSNYGSLNVEGNRFGSEGGGCTLIKSYTDYSNPSSQTESKVTVKNNALFNDTGAMIEFYALPTSIEISGNYGYEATDGLVYFDSAITLTNIRAAMLRGGIKLEDVNGTAYNSILGNNNVKNYLMQKSVSHSTRPLATDLIISRQTDLSVNNLIAGTSGSTYTASPFGGRSGRRYEGSTDGAVQFYLNSTATTAITTALSSVAGWVTVVYHIEIQSATPINAWVDCNQSRRMVTFRPGVNILCNHVYYDGINTPNVYVGFRLENTSDIFDIGPVRIFKNIYDINDMTLEMDGSSWPTSNPPVAIFERDRLLFTALDPSGYIGQVAVDDNGTYKSYGAISA